MRPLPFLPALKLLAGVACIDAPSTAPATSGNPDPALARAPEPATLAAPVFGLAARPDGSILAGEMFVGVDVLRPRAAGTCSARAAPAPWSRRG